MLRNLRKTLTAISNDKVCQSYDWRCLYHEDVLVMGYDVLVALLLASFQQGMRKLKMKWKRESQETHGSGMIGADPKKTRVKNQGRRRPGPGGGGGRASRKRGCYYQTNTVTPILFLWNSCRIFKAYFQSLVKLMFYIKGMILYTISIGETFLIGF